MPHAQAPIGVFDSGLGGLTVVRAIRSRLPKESLVYLGDTARVPYGSRGADTVLQYARDCGQYLEGHGIKALVVACNTVSAVALDMLRVELDVPVLGVILTGAEAGAACSTNGKVGVIATSGTIQSGAYNRAMATINPRIELFSQAAPLLVALAEEGWLHGEVPERVVEHYLQPLAAADIDSLILGCTHYPLLREVIQKVGQRLCGQSLRVSDSSAITARRLEELLRERAILANGSGSLSLHVTDHAERFAMVASRFLGEVMSEFSVRHVRLQRPFR